MLSVWWVNGTDSLRPRIWHYDVFYEFLRATTFMWSCREKIGLQNYHLGFSKFWFFNKKKSKSFLKLFEFFLRFQNFWKNGIYVLDHYIVHVHTIFQAYIIFASHLIAPKRWWPPDGSMVPTHSDLAFVRIMSFDLYLSYIYIQYSNKWIP